MLPIPAGATDVKPDTSTKLSIWNVFAAVTKPPPFTVQARPKSVGPGRHTRGLFNFCWSCESPDFISRSVLSWLFRGSPEIPPSCVSPGPDWTCGCAWSLGAIGTAILHRAGVPQAHTSCYDGTSYAQLLFMCAPNSADRFCFAWTLHVDITSIIVIGGKLLLLLLLKSRKIVLFQKLTSLSINSKYILWRQTETLKMMSPLSPYLLHIPLSCLRALRVAQCFPMARIIQTPPYFHCLPDLIHMFPDLVVFFSRAVLSNPRAILGLPGLTLRPL